MQKPILQKRIFWDVDFDLINYKKDFRFIIERVFERGDVEDIRQCRRFYGDRLVKKVLTKAKYLPEIKLYLASAIYDIPFTKFRCYTQMLLAKGLWPY